ncbi:hypothetical protein LINPERPRIM_LOCUS36673 [Linum perenne]
MTFQATEEALQVLNSSVSQLKWRLRSPAKRRLEIDVLALLTEMRPVIMVDYGGKMPELQDHLCALIKLCQQVTDNVTNGKPATSSNPSTSISDELVDLSSCMQETQITVPTLNGWLLGYPVVYLFGKDFIADAICNLSTKYLRLFRILVRWGDAAAGKGSQLEELMSFSVPYELSMRGRKEEWAEAFLERLQMKWKKCRETWVSLEMEVEECHPQAIVL